MDWHYVVELQPKPTKEEMEWAWRFTVIGRAHGRCQSCARPTRLDACHIRPRSQFPEVAWDPSNGIALCRSCHLKHDHHNNHRPSGREAGYHHSPETREKLKLSAQQRMRTPEGREKMRVQSLAMWDQRGRKALAFKACEQCGLALTKRQLRTYARFCCTTCHYAFRTGKPRSGF